MKKHRIYRAIFLAISLADGIASFVGRGDLHIILKPLIMISLIVYYVSATSGLQAIFVTALLVSLSGDIFLLNDRQGELFFMLGLTSFLIAHILFILSYRRNRSIEAKDALMGVQRIRLAFPVLLAGIGFIVFLYPYLGGMRIPVMAYSAVLVIMVLNALFRYGRTTAKSFWFVFFGALLFMTSDALLAVDKFADHFTYSHAWIMMTYCFAQYFITEGILHHERAATSS